MLHKERVLLVGLLVAALSPVAVRAQGGGRPAISASGTVAVKRNPTRMRMYVQLFSKGKTPEEALAKLKERREAAVLQLKMLKADKDSIHFGDVSFSAEQEAHRQRLEALIREQLRTRGKAPKGLKTPLTATLTTTLSAEWPLDAATQEELLLRSRELAEQIEEADVSGVKEAEKLSPEEAELAEEAREMQNRYGEQSQPPGKPVFLFIAEISRTDREKAMADAFAKAKAKAAELAKAAGVEAGELIEVDGNCSGESSLEQYGYSPYSSNDLYSQVQQLLSRQGENEDGADRAVSTTPGPLAFRCCIHATFAIAKGK